MTADGVASMFTASPRVREMEAEMQDHLARIVREARGDVFAELHALFLLAVEREELAVVGYGGDVVQARIARLRVDDDVRALIGHALRFAAQDERGHAVLARGLLHRTDRLALRLQSLAADVGGLVAGWAAAVLLHTTWRRAPVARVLARAITLGGVAAGKVPDTAKAVLDAQSFRTFCDFQTGAERTAALSWEQIAQTLQRAGPSLSSMAPIAARIAADERSHCEVLALLARSFGDDDAFAADAPVHDAATLAAALARIDPAFLPAPHRASGRNATRVGRGGRVVVRASSAAARGDSAAIAGLVDDAVGRSGLLDAAFAGAPASPRVAIKTTFMMAYDRRDPSPVVDATVVRWLAEQARARGARDVAVLEAPNHYDRFFAGRDVVDVARYVGCVDDAWRVVDVGADQVTHDFARGHAQRTAAGTWRDADVRIVVGKMRTNPAWLVQLTLGALESLGRRIDELLFADRTADLAQGLAMLCESLPPDLCILDATHHVADGLVGILGDPSPCHPGRIYAAVDPLALDLVAARHMGIRTFPPSSPTGTALDWFGDPRPHTIVDGDDVPIAGLRSPHGNDVTVVLSALSYPVYRAGGDRGGLWLPCMDPVAFPARPAALPVVAARVLLRALFGFGRPPRALPPAPTGERP